MACAIKLGQINLLLWATVSSDFISGVIKELKPLQKDQDCCQLLRFYHSDDSGIYMDEMWFLGADTKQESITYEPVILLGGHQRRKLSVWNQFVSIQNDFVFLIGKKMSGRVTFVTFNILSFLTEAHKNVLN